MLEVVLDAFVITTGQWAAFVSHLSECGGTDPVEFHWEEPVKGVFKAAAVVMSLLSPSHKAGRLNNICHVGSPADDWREGSASTLEPEGPAVTSTVSRYSGRCQLRSSVQGSKGATLCETDGAVSHHWFFGGSQRSKVEVRLPSTLTVCHRPHHRAACSGSTDPAGVCGHQR